jgi:hypothetical protein
MAIDDVPITGSFTFLYNAPDELALPTPVPTDTSVSSSTNANHVTDIFVIGLMVFAFVLLIFLSRYAKQTFKTPSKSSRRVRQKSNSKKFIK